MPRFYLRVWGVAQDSPREPRAPESCPEYEQSKQNPENVVAWNGGTERSGAMASAKCDDPHGRLPLAAYGANMPPLNRLTLDHRPIYQAKTIANVE